MQVLFKETIYILNGKTGLGREVFWFCVFRQCLNGYCRLTLVFVPCSLSARISDQGSLPALEALGLVAASATSQKPPSGSFATLLLLSVVPDSLLPTLCLCGTWQAFESSFTK